MAKSKSQKKTPVKASGKTKPAAGPDNSGDERPELPSVVRALGADYGAVLRMRNVRWLVVIAAIVGALYFGWYLSSVFVPLAAALAIAYMLDPLVLKLQKRKIKRSRAVLLIFAGLVAVTVAFGSWFVASMVRDVRNISTQLGELVRDAQNNQGEWIDSWNEYAPGFATIDKNEFSFDAVLAVASDKLAPPAQQLDSPREREAQAAAAGARAELLAGYQRLDPDGDLSVDVKESAALAAMDADSDKAVSLDEWLTHFGAPPAQPRGRTIAPATRQAAEGVWSLVSNGVVSLFTFLLFITLVPIYTWYFMVGYDDVIAKVKEYLPGAHKPRIIRIAGEIDAMAKAFFRGRLVIVIIITVLSTVLFLAFGVRYAFLLGLVAGLGILIPYFSIVAGLIPACLLLAVDGTGGGAIVVFVILFFAIQSFEQYYLTPKLLGDAVELHPVTLLVGVFVMASLFGLFGALLAVPLTAIAKTLGREFLLPYFKSLASEKPAGG